MPIAARFEKVSRNVDIYLKSLDCLNAENLIFKNTLYRPNRNFYRPDTICAVTCKM